MVASFAISKAKEKDLNQRHLLLAPAQGRRHMTTIEDGTKILDGPEFLEREEKMREETPRIRSDHRVARLY